MTTAMATPFWTRSSRTSITFPNITFPMGLPEDVKVINRYVVIQFNLPFLTPAFLHLLLSQQETVTQCDRAAKSPSKFTKFPRFEISFRCQRKSRIF